MTVEDAKTLEEKSKETTTGTGRDKSGTETPVKRRRRRKSADVGKDSVQPECVTSDTRSEENCVPKKKRSVKAKQPNKSNQTLNNSFKATLLVHEAPYVGSYAKKLFGVFKPVCRVNEFIQVEYMKTGFGLVRGYVLVKDAEKLV